jgi:quinol monooxygenase YgiN
MKIFTEKDDPAERERVRERERENKNKLRVLENWEDRHCLEGEKMQEILRLK